jgi:hypothetical protein
VLPRSARRHCRHQPAAGAPHVYNPTGGRERERECVCVLDLTAEGEKVAVVIMDLSIGGVEVAPGGGARGRVCRCGSHLEKRSHLLLWIAPSRESRSYPPAWITLKPHSPATATPPYALPPHLAPLFLLTAGKGRAEGGGVGR